MGEVIPFRTSCRNSWEGRDRRPEVSDDLPDQSVALRAISASLRSAEGHGEAMLQHLASYQERLRRMKDFCDRCKAAAELPSLAEMVKAREELIQALALQSATE